jgi:hypothetical protein
MQTTCDTKSPLQPEGQQLWQRTPQSRRRPRESEELATIRGTQSHLQLLEDKNLQLEAGGGYEYEEDNDAPLQFHVSNNLSP